MYKLSKFNTIQQPKDESYYLIYNTMTKATLKIKNPKYLNDYLKEINKGSLDKDKSVQILIDNGFIVQENFDETKMINYIYKKRYFDLTKLSLILIPTLYCNFACPYCFEKDTQTLFPPSKNYFKALKEHIKKRLPQLEHLHVSLFGGEPLLKKSELIKFLLEIKELCKDRCSFDTSITTNGSLIDQDIIDTLIATNCKSFQITIDGTKDIHNQTRKYHNGDPSFHIILDKFQEVVKRTKDIPEFKTTIRMNLNNVSVQEARQTLEFIPAKYRSYINLIFRPIFNTRTYCGDNKNSTTDLREFYKMGKELGFRSLKNKRFLSSCEACGDINSYHVLPDLSLWKCVNNLTRTEPKIGQIQKDGSVIWNQTNIINWWEAADFSTDPRCQNCRQAPDCMGGCILFNALHGKRKCTPLEMMSVPYQTD